MPSGDLKIYALERLDGDIAYSTTVVPMKLGGLSNPRMQSVNLTLPTPREASVKRVLLEVGLVTREYPERMRWRLWFDDIAVSREYRPKSIARLEDDEGYYSKAVFDVTPIYKHGLDVHRVTIAYEGSSTTIVEHVGLLATYTVPDSVVSYAFLSGALALRPGEAYRMRLKLDSVPSDATHAMLRLVAGLPQRDSVLKLLVNGEEKIRLTGFVGVEDAVSEDIPAAESYEISLVHESGVRNVRVSTLIVTVARRALPDIRVEGVERLDGKVRLRLVNRGVSPSEKTMLLVMVPGEQMKRIELGPMNPGDAKDVEVEAPQGRRTTIRIVWVKHGRPYHREVKI